MTQKTWDADRYDDAFGFVSALGRGLVDLLDPRPGETILDLGCGTGELASVVAARGASVLGIDADEAMIARARREHPELPFEVADAHRFELAEPVDAVMSNAALHWMLDPDAVIARVRAALRPGGRSSPSSAAGATSRRSAARCATVPARSASIPGVSPTPGTSPPPRNTPPGWKPGASG